MPRKVQKADTSGRWIDAAQRLGAAETKAISPASVITAPWVRLKCQFGCAG